jgi:aminoglycoside 6-adenylyltransferase
MRTEQEMLNTIINIAKNDERIRAVYMNGSRINPRVPKDIFQDYDIVYVVTETSSFIKDKRWLNLFGDVLIMQEPDKNEQSQGSVINFPCSYGYLMLFTDGNRIDLHVETREYMQESYGHEKLTLPLLDKDHILSSIPSPTDTDYHVEKPTEFMFTECCNDFWWNLQNVAKGIWRDELPYAKGMFECVVRSRLNEMVSWWIGSQHNFEISVGKMGKYFKKHLPKEYWEIYKKSYEDDNYDNFWNSIFVTCELFRYLGKDVARKLLFTYHIAEDRNMMSYLTHVRHLPFDAKNIY